MQSKILSALTAAVTAADPSLEVVDKRHWANSGTLYVQPKTGFATVLRIDYDFQHSNFKVFVLPESVNDDLIADMPGSMHYSPAGQMAGCSCTTAARNAGCFWTYADYNDGTTIQDVVDFVTTTIRTRVPT